MMINFFILFYFQFIPISISPPKGYERLARFKSRESRPG
jgi:hypothetical protein